MEPRAHRPAEIVAMLPRECLWQVGAAEGEVLFTEMGEGERVWEGGDKTIPLFLFPSPSPRFRSQSSE